MPPKRRASAKAKLRALKVKNERRDKRTEACKSLNELAADLCAGSAQVCLRNTVASDVEHLVRLLEKRTRTPDLPARVHAAAKLYFDNGGHF